MPNLIKICSRERRPTTDS